ncbi:MAG: hypothetical protein P4L98_10470 [Ancalomicrobiaceae bacterium]|nr:hypothetical protein [Ancalomicrobiaceae bacterium]
MKTNRTGEYFSYNEIVIAVFIGTIFLLCGFISGVAFATTIDASETINKYQSIIGAVISSAAALAAAALAWYSVQIQIAYQRNSETRKQLAAVVAFNKHIFGYLKLIDLYWCQLDFATNNHDRSRHFLIRAKQIKTILLDKWTNMQPSIDLLRSQMSLEDQFTSEVFINFNKIFLQEIETGDEVINNPSCDQIHFALSARIWLSHLYEALLRFSDENIELFVGRTRSQVNWDPEWAQFRNYYNEENAW